MRQFWLFSSWNLRGMTQKSFPQRRMKSSSRHIPIYKTTAVFPCVFSWDRDGEFGAFQRIS
ncbi:hypothetical protein XH92_38775 [Bradyrhizobium sp. CCBAU 53421]|nr:hypothetical protein XH92_38775 [Bradyrhizobium sp. CCBAU 53421]